jgi:hypothetical protein
MEWLLKDQGTPYPANLSDHIGRLRDRRIQAYPTSGFVALSPAAR